MPPRSTVVTPFVSGIAATCWPVVALRRRAVAVPEPPPPGENMLIVAVNERQAATVRPGEGPIEVVEAPPVVLKLTGAWVRSTRSRTGLPAGPDRRACHRTPCTVSRKFNASLELETVTGK